jgi:hypothetical protein
MMDTELERGYVRGHIQHKFGGKSNVLTSEGNIILVIGATSSSAGDFCCCSSLARAQRRRRPCRCLIWLAVWAGATTRTGAAAALKKRGEKLEYN